MWKKQEGELSRGGASDFSIMKAVSQPHPPSTPPPSNPTDLTSESDAPGNQTQANRTGQHPPGRQSIKSRNKSGTRVKRAHKSPDPPLPAEAPPADPPTTSAPLGTPQGSEWH